MRFRSIGVSATNIKDYLSRVKELEDNYLIDSLLTHIGIISLEANNYNDGHLGPNSLYKLTNLKTKRKRKWRKNFKFQTHRKKLHFHHETNNDNNDSKCNE
jgi:hypothetical protein